MQKKHHISICNMPNEDQTLLTMGKTNKEGIFPVVLVKVNRIKCQVLIDSGAGSSYASAKLLDTLKLKPVQTKTRRIGMLMTSRTARLEIYNANVQALDSDYKLDVNLTRVNKNELLFIDSPRYESLVRRFQHLKEAKLNDNDAKASLPIHIILGNGEYACIKTKDEKDTSRKRGRSYSGMHKVGMVCYESWYRFDVSPMMLTPTSQSDYEQLCQLDVLGLSDTAEHDHGSVYKEFREQLQRSPEGWYETGLPWKGNHPSLPTNVKGSLQRLTTKGLSAQYDAVIEDQKAQGIVKEAPSKPQGKEFYIPHKEVVRETAASTKLHVVCDASDRETPNSPLLNDCL
jgi:hypothetical protein